MSKIGKKRKQVGGSAEDVHQRLSGDEEDEIEMVNLSLNEDDENQIFIPNSQ